MREVSSGASTASSPRRAVAVFTDFMVYFALWIAVGLFAPTNSFFYMIGLLLLSDVLGTAYLGLTPGRLLTGIRVVRQVDNRPPGLRRALVRMGVVLVSGWLGLLLFGASVRTGREPQRMWWDVAAGTALVNARHRDQQLRSAPRLASKPFNEWSFSATAGVAVGALILSLFSLTNGQTFPIWMLIGLLGLAGAGLIDTYAMNTYRRRLAIAMHAIATAAIVLLGIGVIVSARPADAISKAIVVADVYSSSTRTSGLYYELAATDGSYYSLTNDDFQPSLPKLDDPRYRGDEATLTLDRGTAGVLAIDIDGAEYTTATYSDPRLKLIKGLAIGGLLVLIASVMAIAFGYLRWVRRALGRAPTSPHLPYG